MTFNPTDLERENAALINGIMTLRTIVEAQGKTISELMSTNEALEIECDNYSMREQELEDAISELETRSFDFQMENRNLVKRLKDDSKLMVDLLCINRDLQDERDSYSDEEQELDNRIVELEERCVELQEENRNLVKTLMTLLLKRRQPMSTIQ